MREAHQSKRVKLRNEDETATDTIEYREKNIADEAPWNVLTLQTLLHQDKLVLQGLQCR